MTLFCMVSTLLRVDMSPESRLVGEGETTVTESAPREVLGGPFLSSFAQMDSDISLLAM